MEKIRNVSSVKNVALFFLAFAVWAYGRAPAGEAYVLEQGKWEKAPDINIDGMQESDVYGEREGLLRVAEFEKQLHAAKIRQDHPRLYLTSERIGKIRAAFPSHPGKDAIVKDADSSGDQATMILANAFLYQMFKQDKAGEAAKYAAKAAEILKGYDSGKLDLAYASLAFDWICESLSDADKSAVVDKLKTAAKLEEIAKKPEDDKCISDMFHREEWASGSIQNWVYIALAHHVPEAEKLFLRQFKWTQYYGDAARSFAYTNGGTMFEGYYKNTGDVFPIFKCLLDATGVDIIYRDGNTWFMNGPENLLYRFDSGTGRETNHFGSSSGKAVFIGNDEKRSGGKATVLHGAALLLAGYKNPYLVDLYNRLIGADKTPSALLMGSPYINNSAIYPPMQNIAYAIFYDPALASTDIRKSPEASKPASLFRKFDNQVYMRSDWSDGAIIVGHSVRNIYTANSHGHRQPNAFTIYRKGILSADSGGYQGGYFCGPAEYAYSTIAANCIVVQDTQSPQIKSIEDLGKSRDPGVPSLSCRSFGTSGRFNNAFLFDGRAGWGRIAAYKQGEGYTYSAGDAAGWYKADYNPKSPSKLKEYVRHVVFIPKGNSGYLVVFDRVEASDPRYKPRFTMQFVGEPVITGTKTKEYIPYNDEVYEYEGIESKNYQESSALTVRTLLPRERTLERLGGHAKVSPPTSTLLPVSIKGQTRGIILMIKQNDIVRDGIALHVTKDNKSADLEIANNKLTIVCNGEKYEYGFDTYKDIASLCKAIEKNGSFKIVGDFTGCEHAVRYDQVIRNYYTLPCGGVGSIDDVQGNTHSSFDECGVWKIFIDPKNDSPRQYFLNVIYIDDPGKKPGNIDFKEDDASVTVSITDPEMKTDVRLNKTGKIGGHVAIDKAGKKLADDDLPEAAIAEN